MRRFSIRTRLTMAYTGALAVLLAAYAGGVFVFFRDGLHTQLDRQLFDNIDQAEHTLRWTPDGSRLTWLAAEHGDDNAADGRWLEVWNMDRALLYRSPAAAHQPITPVRPARDLSAATTAHVPGQIFRVRERRASVEGRPVFMRAAQSENAAHAELSRISWILSIGLPLGAVCATVAGYSLARRALAPVDRLATRASAITADRLGERLPIETPDDELGRLAQAFNATLARLEQSFDWMRRFTSDASHELRTPLTAIRSVGEVGLQGSRSPEAYREIIGSMLEEVDRFNQLVESLLTLSRADAGDIKLARQSVDLASVVEDTVTRLQVLAEEKGQHVESEVSRPAPLSADPVLLRRAIVNLLDNAIKYSPAGTPIHVTLSIADGHALVSIRDRGPGISEADQAHIFDRFYRVDRSRSRETDGVGLGLAIARWVVEAHGGQLTVESEKGRGSTFRIRLPLDVTSGA